LAKRRQARPGRSEGRDRRFSVRDYPFFFMHQIVSRNNANIGAALKSRKLTPTVWRVLAILQEHDGMHIGALSQESVIERTLLSRIVAGLERKGLVRRKPDPGDRRFTAVHLQPAGHRAFGEILPIARRQIEAAIEGLSKQDLKRLQALLLRITANVERAR
jgi:DNA-binding MarR family transcriptional regulator